MLDLSHRREGRRGGRVQEDDSGGEKTFPQSAGLGSQVSVSPTRREEGKKTMVGVRGVFNNVLGLPQALPVINGLNTGERCSDDALGGFHHPLQ